MTYRYVLGVSLALILSGCQSTQSPSSRIRPLQSDEPAVGASPVDATADGGPFAGVDPIVAHFFNTATEANDDAAVLVANQDGGANADAGD